jgi:hypothetical protein
MADKRVFLALLLAAALRAFAQEPPVVSRISWEPVDFVSRYEVSVEVRVQTGSWLEITRKVSEEEPFVDCPFFAGDYRFRISVFDLLGNPGSSTDWNYFEVRSPVSKPAPPPAARDAISQTAPAPAPPQTVPMIRPEPVPQAPGFIAPEEAEKTWCRLEGLVTPLVTLPFGAFNEIYATSPIQPLGGSLRFTVLPLQTGFGTFGVDGMVSWNYLANDILHSSRFTNIAGLQVSALWQIRPFNRRTALNVRAGFAMDYIHSRFEFNDGRISHTLESWNPSVNAGAALLVFLNKSLFVDMGMDFVQIFSADVPSLSYLRPSLGLGWWF